jgi:hypothetical protein
MSEPSHLGRGSARGMRQVSTVEPNDWTEITGAVSAADCSLDQITRLPEAGAARGISPASMTGPKASTEMTALLRGHFRRLVW